MQQLPDVVEGGRVLATLNDWRAITYAFMFLLVVAVIERVWYQQIVRKERADMASERERMWSVSEKFGDAADKYSEAAARVATELEVSRALNARLEGVVNTLERRVTDLVERVDRK